MSELYNDLKKIHLIDLIISFFLQVVPWACWLFFILKKQNPYSPKSAMIFFTLAVLFGNTASLFMKSYFGHAIAALFVFVSLYFGSQEKWFVAAGALGFAILSEYSCALLIFPFLYLVFESLLATQRVFKIKNALNVSKQILLGGIFPGFLWVFYHLKCFGGPLSIANAYQNEVFVSQNDSLYKMGGLISYGPQGSVLLELLFGFNRGLLVTQPWVFLVIAFSLYLVVTKSLKNGEKKIVYFTIFSLILFLFLNASFNGWHGGNSPGPRYLAPVLPLFGFVAFILWKKFGFKQRLVLWITLVPSLVFYIAVSSSTLLKSPAENLWPTYLRIR